MHAKSNLRTQIVTAQLAGIIAPVEKLQERAWQSRAILAQGTGWAKYHDMCHSTQILTLEWHAVVQPP